MKNEEFHALMEHFYFEKWIAAQIKADLGEVHGDSIPVLKAVYF